MRLEKQAEIVQRVFPAQSCVPPGMLGEMFSGRGLGPLFRWSFLLGKAKGRTMKTHELIGTEHDFPPPLNFRIVRDPIIGPTQLIFRVFQPIFDPGTQAIRVPGGLLNLALQVGPRVTRFPPSGGSWDQW